MIAKIHYCRCRKCGSTNIIKNGHDYKGAQKFHCHDCKAYGTLDWRQTDDSETHRQALDAYFERVSMRGVERIFNISRYTLARWLLTIFKKLPPLAETLVKWELGDVLELDELWSFVLKKSQKRWVWIALCRRTRQIVAFAIGDRSEATCHKLWDQIPTSYKQCATFSDFWEAYQIVFPQETHQCVGKETGLTAHVERWNLTLRQSLARFVRKTLSFSKSDLYHQAVLSTFIHRYNCSLLYAISQF
jgi:IS1 family transposase/transposase-like protein